MYLFLDVAVNSDQLPERNIRLNVRMLAAKRVRPTKLQRNPPISSAEELGLQT